MIGDEDLSIFENDFGVDAVFTVAAGSSIGQPETLTVKGIFNAPTQGVALMPGMKAEAVEPSITCRTSAVAAVRPKMQCVIEGRHYQVEVKSDIGIGYTDVVLKTSNG